MIIGELGLSIKYDDEKKIYYIGQIVRKANGTFYFTQRCVKIAKLYFKALP